MRRQIVRRALKANQGLAELHPILQRIYSARHVQSIKELDREFDALHSYESLIDIHKACQLLADAIMHQQRILIVGDFDTDGATSTALAHRALRSFGAQAVQFLVPNRFVDGYGLTPELVNAAKKFTPDIILTVDNGIANYAGVEAALAEGIRVIITDHHLAPLNLPRAHAIVNPNQPHDPFPSKNLAGVGVIFYVMLALRRHLIERNWFADQALPIPNMSRLLDLVALGTVADLVPLDANNRILVHQGLRRIRAGQCAPAIIALLELAGRDFTRTLASDLGFSVAARLNAAGRLDDMSLGIECLLCDDAAQVRQMAKTLDQLNDERRHIEHAMQAQALKTLDQLTPTLNTGLPKGLCLFDETWHQGVIGILAARIKDRFHRPVIVFAPHQQDELKGSARSIHGLHIRDVLALIDAQYPNLIQKFGGHAMAAGLTLMRQQLEKFTQVFNEVVSMQLTDDQLQHILLSDGELHADEISLEVASLLRDAGPFGQAFPEPLFDDKFRILEQRLIQDKHLKLRLEKQNKILEAIVFFVDPQIWPNHRCEFIHAAYRLDVNEYKGRRNVQLILEHFEPV